MELSSRLTRRGPRTAGEVIDKAIAENRVGEWLLYVLATLFAVVGLTVIVLAMVSRQPVVAVAGSIASIMFWPAVNSARQTRKEGIAIRLLEAPLSRADTAKDAADMLHRFFGALMLQRTVRAKANASSQEGA